MPILGNFPGGGGSGNGGLQLAPVTGVETLTAAGKVYIKWTDPDDLVVAGSTLAAWAGTILVRKAGSAPISRRDGVIVMDSKTRDAYKSTYFCDSGLTDGVTYYYKLFPYSSTGTYTDSDDSVFAVTPNPVLIGDVSALAVVAQLNGRVQLTWNDPDATKVQDGVTLSTWASTKIVYKTDGYPTSPDDGTLAENSTTRNAHTSSPLEITGLTNGTTYYFALFPISTDGAATASKAGHITATPNKIKLTTVPEQIGTLTYTGAELTPTFSNYDPAQLTIGGVVKNTAAGTHKATFTPTDDYCWDDGTTEAKEVPWTIEKASITVPTTSSEFTYDGNQKSPVWTGYDSSKMTMTGDNTGTNAGDYTVFFTPTANYQWSDGTTDAKSVSWSIGKKSIEKVTATDIEFTYDGSAHFPTWNNYNPDEITIDGTITAQIGASPYTTTFILKSNYQWTDGTTNNIYIDWYIYCLIVPFPSADTTSFIYTGSAQAPTFTYDSNYIDASGDITGKINAGNYSATFTLKDCANTMWTNRTESTKSIAWSIKRADCNFSLNKTSVTLNDSKLTDTVIVSRDGDGKIGIFNNDPSVATASVSGNTITISHVNKKSGTTTIYVSIDKSTNYEATLEKEITVTAEFVPTMAALNDMSWADIRKVSDAGLASTYWNVGDVKRINIQGTIGSTYVSTSIYVFILGFDHNSSKEGANRIHFQIGKFDKDSNNSCLVELKYDSSNTADGSFTMNPSSSSSTSSGGAFSITLADSSNSETNIGGWENSHMRKTVLGSDYSPTGEITPSDTILLYALPRDLCAVMKSCTKYSNNTGGTAGEASEITATIDYLWLLSEFEVFGSRNLANEYESNYQEQYAYYKAGNSKIFYKYNETSYNVCWWLRSASVSTSSFCRVTYAGLAGAARSGVSSGIAPAFCV